MGHGHFIYVFILLRYEQLLGNRPKILAMLESPERGKCRGLIGLFQIVEKRSRLSEAVLPSKPRM